MKQINLFFSTTAGVLCFISTCQPYFPLALFLSTVIRRPTQRVEGDN